MKGKILYGMILLVILISSILAYSLSSYGVITAKVIVKEYVEPSIVQQKVLIIPMTTSDVPIPNYATKEWINNWIFGTDGFSMNDYFKQNSYGLYSISGEVTDWVVLNSSEYYKTFERESPQYMALDAVRIVDEKLDFSSFDGDDNGRVDTVIFFVPDEQYESLGQPYRHFSYAIGPFFKIHYGLADGKNINSYLLAELPSEYPPTTRSGRIRFGQTIHEFSHIAPIRYYGRVDYSASEFIGDLYNAPNWIQRYGIMSTGANNDDSPSHFSGYAKMMIGWLNPKEVIYGENETIRLYKTEESFPYTSNIKLIKVPRSRENENLYYLLEWRYIQEFEGHNFDVGLQTASPPNHHQQGLVIYRVNVTAYPDWIGRKPNIVQVVSPVHQIILEEERVQDWFPNSFGSATGIFKFESEEGIIIEITSIAQDETYVDIRINYQ